MQKLRVIAHMGLTVPGPAKLKLSKAQIERRKAQLGKPGSGGAVTLEAGQALTFKSGEIIEIDAIGKLPRAAFMVEDEAKPAKPAKGGKPAKGAKGAEPAPDPAGAGAGETLEGGSGQDGAGAGDTVEGGSGEGDTVEGGNG